MARPKKEDSVKTEEEKIEEPTLATAFEYSSVGNVAYDFLKENVVFDIKAQTPFRMNPGDVRTISSGLKIRIPEGYVGLITSADVNVKTQVCVLGAPVILEPSIEPKEILVTLKMLGYGYKIYNMGDKLASLVLLPWKPVKTEKK